MSNYSLPLFMQVKESAVQDLNKNLSLYMPKLIIYTFNLFFFKKPIRI